MNDINSKTMIIFVTGGVFSALGKGITCSSVGALLKNLSFNVMNVKLDPYLNIDAGTMSPYQHGEVFVTKLGKETDLDVGNYERFLNMDLPNESNITSGHIYSKVLEDEREGKYLGKTVQVIPHITDRIKDEIINITNKYQPDFLIVEVGGTVGDIESIPFLEVIRQMISKNRDQIMLFHTVPILSMLTSSEEKTKPLQHSVKELMGNGIIPDVVLVRTKNEISEHIQEKISLTCGIAKENIISIPNMKNIYFLPEFLLKQNLHNIIFKKFKIDPINANSLGDWSLFTNKIRVAKQYKVRIALVGKYTEIADAYTSVINSLEIASFHLNSEIIIDVINSEKVNETNYHNFKHYNGILIPGGFGNRGLKGKMLAIKYARENNVPLLGICLGMQLMSIEFAINVLNLSDANSVEFDETTTNPIITIIEGKFKNKQLGGTLRLGEYECKIDLDSAAYNAYQQEFIYERHRHRYEFNNKYLDIFKNHGMIASGINMENNLVEIIELKNHKFFVGCQFHPEFTSKTFKPNPLFYQFIKSSMVNI